VFFGVRPALSPEEAAQLCRAAEDSPANSDAIARATRAALLARYYEDARTLARMLTSWSKGLPSPARRFIVCSGAVGDHGGRQPGGRRSPRDLGGAGDQPAGRAVGEPLHHRELGFEFHYFFMRKVLASLPGESPDRLPGGFGTLDELFEILTLVQTRKIGKRMPIVLYGRAFWEELLRLDVMVAGGRSPLRPGAFSPGRRTGGGVRLPPGRTVTLDAQASRQAASRSSRPTRIAEYQWPTCRPPATDDFPDRARVGSRDAAGEALAGPRISAMSWAV